MAQLKRSTVISRTIIFIALAATCYLAVSHAASIAQTSVDQTVNGLGLGGETEIKGPMVVDVQITGNRTLVRERIMREVLTRQGRKFSEDVLRDDVHRLMRSGMFVSVKPYTQKVPGGYVVIFEVTERPILTEVKFIGNRAIGHKKIVETADLKVKDPVDPSAVRDAQARIEELYHSKGYGKARVTIAEGARPEDRRAVFLIHEGPKQRIWGTYFIGNSIVSDGRLKTQIKSKAGIGWYLGGDVDYDEIEADVKRLKNYYVDIGYHDVRVGRELRFSQDQTWLSLTFVIHEGPQFKIGEVKFVGNERYSQEELMERMKLRPGQPYNRAKLDTDIQEIKEYYGRVGHLFARVEPEPRRYTHEMAPKSDMVQPNGGPNTIGANGEQPRIDLVFNINEGRRYHVGRILVEIEGDNPRTKITTLLNRISLKPGDIVDIRKLRDSERRFRASGLFEVGHDGNRMVAPQFVLDPPKHDEETMVAEGPSGYRGQSPDVVLPAGAWRLAAPSDTPPDRSDAVDIVIPVRRVAAGASDAAATETTPFRPAPTPIGPFQPRPAAAQHFTPRPASAFRGQSPDPPATLGGEVTSNPYGTSPSSRSTLPDSPYSSSNTQWQGAGSPMQSTAGGQPDLNWLPPTGSALATPSGATTSLPPGATAPAATNQGTPLKWGPSSTTTSAPSGGTFASGGTSTQLPVTNTAGGIHAVNTAAAVNNYATTVPPASENPYLLPAGQAAPGVVHAGATAPLVTGGPMQTSPVAPAYGQQQLRGPYIGDPLERVPDRFPAVPGPLPRDGGVFEPNSPAFLEEQTVPFDLRVIGQETQTGRLQLGAGVNSDAGLVGSFVIDERNFDLWKFPNSWADFYNGTAFRGAGQHLRIEAVPGTVVQRYMIQFEEPYLGPTRISFGISGSFFNRLYTEWDEERLGGRVSFGYQFTHDLVGSIAIRMENVTLYNPIVGYVPQINEALGKSSLYGFRGTLSHDTRDNQYLATQGHMFSMSFEQVVGTYIYPRFELDYRRYYKIRERADGSGRHILSLSAQTGWTGSNTPVYEHYFAGGFTTIRGFDFRGASPVYGPDDVVVGGEFQLLASAQYLFPITPDDMLRGVVFCDSGTVEPSLDQWSDKYRVSVGFGLRISVPAMGPAPIALDFAFPIQAEPFDREQVFSFFVGLNR